MTHVTDFPSTQEHIVAVVRRMLCGIVNDWEGSTAALQAEMVAQWNFIDGAGALARDTVNYPTTSFEIVAKTRSVLAEAYRIAGNTENLALRAEMLAQFIYGGAVVGADVEGDLPVITVQPVGADLNAGDTLSLSVTATGADSYQWYKDSVLIAGATGSSHIKTATVADAGSYTCVVKNVFGSVTSDAAVVTVAEVLAASFELQADTKVVVEVPKTVSKTELNKVSKANLVLVLNGELDLRTAIEEAGGNFDN